MHTRTKRDDGFTLSELLIVVAIVAVLVAIAIPVFTAQLKSAQEATCLANRTSAAHALTTAYITDGDGINAAAVLEDAMGIKNVTTSGNRVIVPAGQGLCSTDGIVTLTQNNGTYTATCSVHGGDGHTLSSVEDLTAIWNVLAAENVSNIDSGAATNNPGSHAAKALAKMKELGFDLEAMGAATWQYNTKDGGKFLYWSTVDISGLSNGAKVPVMRYNFTTGTFTVWIGTVEAGVTSDAAKKPYNKLSTSYTGYEPSTTSAKDTQTYDQMVKYYEEALAKNN